jgi:hypothetical protein
MRLRIYMAALLLGALGLVAMLPTRAPAAESPQYTLVMVSDGKPAMKALEDQVFAELADLRKRQGLKKTEMPILSYHFNNPNEKNYCEKKLGIKANDLFFLGVGQYVVKNGAFNVTNLVFSDRQIVNPRKACLELFAQTLRKKNIALSKRIELEVEISAALNGLIAQSNLSDKKVAVGQPVDASGKISRLSPFIADVVEAALVDHKTDLHCEVVEKNALQESVADWSLGRMGLVDQSTRTPAASILGVDVFCFTNYRLDGNTLHAKIEMTNAQGNVVASAAPDFTLDNKLLAMAQQYLSEPVASQTAPPTPAPASGPLKLNVWTDKASYKVGDNMKISLQANQDCYVTLIDVGTSGKATVIFPNHYCSDNRVKAGVTYQIPDPSAGFDYEVGPPAGVEIIRGIASREPNPDLGSLNQGTTAQAPFATVSRNLSKLSRDVHVRARKAKVGQWSESVTRVQTSSAP